MTEKSHRKDRKERKPSKDFHLPKVLHLFADIQEHLHNGTIRHELSQIARHTRDKEILEICDRAAECLEIEIDTKFRENNPDQHSNSLRTLTKHLKWAYQRFDEILELMPVHDPDWTEALFHTTERQLLDLSNYYALLDKVPDISDRQGEVIKIGDLVAIRCKDEKEQEYAHYGVVIPSPKGFRIAHFFTGATVKYQNSLAEKGFGYVHELPYDPDWLAKEHLPDSTPFSQVEERIKESRKMRARVWSKISYNCEHWAREMFCGTPSCTQWREQKNQQSA